MTQAAQELGPEQNDHCHRTACIVCMASSSQRCTHWGKHNSIRLGDLHSSKGMNQVQE
jgi:hypothetical protein